MKKGRSLSGIGASIGMLMLILDGKTAIEGARQGIELCLRTVIPSLFPFFVLSGMLTGSILGTKSKFLRPLGSLCGIPEGAESLLLVGFLGGYPVGAQCVADAYRSSRLGKADAERMLGFCSNAGPSFLFGIAASMFPGRETAWVLWGIHILSAILTGVILPGKSVCSVRISQRDTPSLSDSMISSVKVMASVCGWIVLFRVVIAFLQRWVLWLLRADAQAAVIGLLELSNGCCELGSVGNVSARLILCSALLAIGGLCVTMQTFTVTKGLSLRFYFPGKLLQTTFSLMISVAYIYGFGMLCAAMLCILAGILRKIEKKGSIPRLVGV